MIYAFSQDVIIALLAGVISGAIYFAFYYLGIWLVGAILIGLLAYTQTEETILIIIAALIGGGLFVTLHDVFMILSTSVTGAFLMTYGLIVLYGTAVGESSYLLNNPVSYAAYILGTSQGSVKEIGSIVSFHIILFLGAFISGTYYQFRNQFRYKSSEAIVD